MPACTVEQTAAPATQLVRLADVFVTNARATHFASKVLTC